MPTQFVGLKLPSFGWLERSEGKDGYPFGPGVGERMPDWEGP